MPRREEIRAGELPAPMGLYTDAVRWGDLLFVSGCGPIDADGALVGEGDLAEQTRQVLRNIGAILATVGAGFDDIVKETAYVTDIGQRRAMHPVRREFFGAARPASTLVEVSQLAVPGMMVEIDVIAGLRT